MSTIRRFLVLSTVGIVLALSLSIGMASEHPRARRALEGTWTVTVTSEGLPDPFEALATYTAGGGYIFTKFSTTPDRRLPLPGHGAWEFVEPGVFNASFVEYNINPELEFISTLHVRARITLNDTGDEYTSIEQVELRNREGEIIAGPFNATTVAQRMRVKPLK